MSENRRARDLVRIDSLALGGLRKLAKKRGVSIAKLVGTAVLNQYPEGTLATSTKREKAPPDEPKSPKVGRLVRLEFAVGADAAARYKAFAVARRMPLTSVLSQLVSAGFEVYEHRNGIPPTRIDELIELLVELRQRLEVLGPSSLGMTRILTAWASRTGEFGVTEEELLQELEATGRDEWESALDVVGKARAVVIGGAK